MSLNKALMQGPDLVNSLVAVLLRFRIHAIALVADIEAMFYQVMVAPKDKDSLRYLWWPDGNLDREPAVHRMKVHLFGATSSPCCAAFCLRQSAVDFGAEFEPYITSAVQQNFYVDDGLFSAPNVEIAQKMLIGVKSLLSKASFNLTKWMSTSDELMKDVPKSQRSTSFKVDALSGNLNERILGINWNVKTDEFSFSINLPWKPRTKRGLLSTANSVFDPLGFVCPVILEARLLYRKICDLELEWDEPLHEAELLRWEKWLET